MSEWSLTLAAAPTCENEHRKMHYRPRSAHDREWRTWAAIEARRANLPRDLHAVEILAVHERRNRAAMPDVAGCAPTVKAVIDGLVDYGLVRADGPDVVHELRFRVAVTGRDALTLTITEVEL